MSSNELSTKELGLILQNMFSVDGYATAKKIIIEASAIIAYQQLPQAIQILVCDDAPQFKQITKILALCWVHAGRHYNNPAELDARVQARRRDISYQTQNPKGVAAKDTLMSVVQTAIKLKVNVFAYIKDRISKTVTMTPLTTIIQNVAAGVPSG